MFDPIAYVKAVLDGKIVLARNSRQETFKRVSLDVLTQIRFIVSCDHPEEYIRLADPPVTEEQALAALEEFRCSGRKYEVLQQFILEQKHASKDR